MNNYNKKFTKFNFNASKFGAPMNRADSNKVHEELNRGNECDCHEEEVVQNNIDQKRSTIITSEMVANVVNKTLANKYAQTLMEIQSLKKQIEVYRNTIKVLLEEK